MSSIIEIAQSSALKLVPDTLVETGIHPGCFIVIEGVDGAGKTTLAQRLTDRLNRDMDGPLYNGASYIREPGSTAFADIVREGFVNSTDLHPMTEVLALMACKNELLDKRVRPAIRGGQVVVCDRYTRTLLAYQGGLRGVPMVELIQLLAATGLLILPNLEIFLHVDAETSIKRRGKALNAFDDLAEQNAAKLREGFEEAVRKLPNYRRIDVDASGSPDEVLEEVYAHVKKHLKFHRFAGQTLMAPIRDYQLELVEEVQALSVKKDAQTAQDDAEGAPAPQVEEVTTIEQETSQ